MVPGRGARAGVTWGISIPGETDGRCHLTGWTVIGGACKHVGGERERVTRVGGGSSVRRESEEVEQKRDEGDGMRAGGG